MAGLVTDWPPRSWSRALVVLPTGRAPSGRKSTPGAPAHQNDHPAVLTVLADCRRHADATPHRLRRRTGARVDGGGGGLLTRHHRRRPVTSLQTGVGADDGSIDWRGPPRGLDQNRHPSGTGPACRDVPTEIDQYARTGLSVDQPRHRSSGNSTAVAPGPAACQPACGRCGRRTRQRSVDRAQPPRRPRHGRACGVREPSPEGLAIAEFHDRTADGGRHPLRRWPGRPERGRDQSRQSTRLTARRSPFADASAQISESSRNRDAASSTASGSASSRARGARAS